MKSEAMVAALADVPAVEGGPWVTRFGADPDGWNVDRGPIGFNPHSGAEPMFDDDDDEEDGDGSGLPGMNLVARALDIFVECWGAFDLTTAARAFNLSSDLVELAMMTTAPPLTDGVAVEVPEQDLGEAVQLISSLRHSEGEASVVDIARILNQPASRIIEVVGSHPWLFISGHGDDLAALTIGHEGE